MHWQRLHASLSKALKNIKNCKKKNKKKKTTTSTHVQYWALDPPTRRGYVDLTTSSCPQRTDTHLQIRNCQLWPAAHHTARPPLWSFPIMPLQKAEVFWSDREVHEQFWIFQLHDLIFYPERDTVCALNGWILANILTVNHISYIKSIVNWEALGLRAVFLVTDQILDEGRREKLWSRQKKKKNIGYDRMLASFLWQSKRHSTCVSSLWGI